MGRSYSGRGRPTLSPRQVQQIKRDLRERKKALKKMEQYTLKAIAKRRGTTPQIVHMIEQGKTYKRASSAMDLAMRKW